MSVHWKRKEQKHGPSQSQMQLAKEEARDRRIKEQKRLAFLAKVEEGVGRVMSVLNGGGVVVRSEKCAIDIYLWKAINREVIHRIKGEEGFRFLWDDEGFMAEGPGHCIRKVAKAA
jgi:hypothetical protein